MLKAFRLELPPCETRDMTFSGQSSAPGIDLAMSFTAPKDCVEKYLTDHHVDRTNPIHWPDAGETVVGNRTLSPTRPPFDADHMKQFKLKLDPAGRYDVHVDFVTPKEAGFKVLLVPQGELTSVYMESRLTGNVGKSG
ncbi:hypothetical protein ACFXGI_15095 [Streptomyces sp. NPDC059355]|uniref:hypothetical protein n=1 Tax=Streptomyces sp. NPDC059355 TaxID=3346811 RepID=UPI0036BD5091